MEGPDCAVRSRKANWTSLEIETLISALEDREELRNGIFGSVIKNAADQRKEWEVVSTLVNAVSFYSRSAKDCRDKWRDLKTRTKTKLWNMKKRMRNFSGRPPPHCLTDIEEKVIWLAPSIALDDTGNNTVITADVDSESSRDNAPVLITSSIQPGGSNSDPTVTASHADTSFNSDVFEANNSLASAEAFVKSPQETNFQTFSHIGTSERVQSSTRSEMQLCVSHSLSMMDQLCNAVGAEDAPPDVPATAKKPKRDDAESVLKIHAKRNLELRENIMTVTNIQKRVSLRLRELSRCQQEMLRTQKKLVQLQEAQNNMMQHWQQQNIELQKKLVDVEHQRLMLEKERLAYEKSKNHESSHFSSKSET